MSWRNKPRKKRSKIWAPSKTDLEKVVKESTTLSYILKKYNLETSSSNYRSLKNRLYVENIDYSHIKLGKDTNKYRVISWVRRPPQPINSILTTHSTYNRTRLKTRLLKEGLLSNICYSCKMKPEWCGQPLSLQIDHINGISDDNRLINLRMLCPNCHAQTGTFGGKRLSKQNN